MFRREHLCYDDIGYLGKKHSEKTPMLSPLVLDYIACILYIFILISIVYKHLYHTTENRFFIAAIIICGVTTILDIFMEASYRSVPIGRGRLFFAYLFSYAYLIMRQVCAYAYIVFIYVASGTLDRLHRRGRQFTLIIPFVLTIGFILSNLFTNKVFRITSEGGYHRGSYMMVLYGAAYIVAIFGILYLCRMRRYLGTPKWMAMISMYVFMTVSVILQMIFEGTLLEMCSTALALLFVHLILHWSKDYAVDMGLYSWYEFRELAERLAKVRRRSTILFIRFVNANEVRTTYGEARYNDFIRKTVSEITQIIRKKTYDYRIFYHTSGSLTVVFGEGGIDIEKEYPELIDMWTSEELDSYVMRLGVRMCSQDFPVENLSEEEDLTGFSFIFPQYMNRDEIFFRGERAISNHGFEMYRKLPTILSNGIREQRFEMYYQPIYDVKEEKFFSAEALIRLKDPEYGFVPPGLFIPSAERRNLILPIGSFVLDSVFRFAARPDFEDMGLQYIELNLSVEQLLQDSLVDEIHELQQKYRISSMRINLEITESAAGVQSKISLQNIARLREEFYSFSLDDFGTGYSNIQRAVELPLSLVKIDKSIIDKVETVRGESMIRNTIQMMHEIGFGVVGEGVETEAQFKILKRIGCDYIQGYYFAKPMCETDFVNFLKEHNFTQQRPEDEQEHLQNA